MKILKHPLFLVAIVIVTVLYSANRFEVPLPNWMYFYVNDFLCMPIVLSACLAILRILKKTKTLYVPISVVLALTLYFSIYFEWLMPQINTRYTSDIIDVGLYFLGAILFFKFQKQLF
ncbi:hypothetical protein DFQ09_105269 [Winogradskyella pacifica]|uniref:Magnesium citrate secondary transporter n=1 Tax=Winogradskyella pacifica TaxID=664642 RepID=A0A3D9MB34_9FLAO|nr:hypothetical protein [Winogradskyella pacifica]REE17055.1 hypothetical protein DFQ09_105269 [Winogradskyella pacifica]